MSLSNYDKHLTAFRGWRDGAGGKPMEPTYTEDPREEVQTIYNEAYLEGRKTRGQYAVDSAARYGVKLSPLRVQELQLTPPASDQSAELQHAGDCSIYKADCEICDCGALRQFVSGSNTPSDAIWEQWAKHQAALARSTIPPVP